MSELSESNESIYTVKNTLTYQNYNGDDCVHIGYGIDDHYARCTAASIASICINNSYKHFSFYIAALNLSEENKDKFAELAAEYAVNITIFEIESATLQSLPTKINLPTPVYFKLILPLLVKNKNIHTLFYIDGDILCLNNADELFEIDLGDKIIAAVPAEKGKPYFYAGLLAIDVQKWCQEDVANKVISRIAESQNKQKYPALEKDALNEILSGKVKYIDSRFNCIDVNSMSKLDIIFLHFTANPKPWQASWKVSRKCNEFNIDLYTYYESSTPWNYRIIEMPKNHAEMKYYAQCLWEHDRKKESISWYVKSLITKLQS